MKIGQMMDRIVWEVFNNDSLSNIRVYSANNIKNLTSEGYTVKIYGVSDDVKLNELRSYADLVSKEEISELSPSIGIFSSTMLKTTTFGKALIITVPILIVLVILIIGISVITHFIKKRRKNSPTV